MRGLRVKRYDLVNKGAIVVIPSPHRVRTHPKESHTGQSGLGGAGEAGIVHPLDVTGAIVRNVCSSRDLVESDPGGERRLQHVEGSDPAEAFHVVLVFEHGQVGAVCLTQTLGIVKGLQGVVKLVVTAMDVDVVGIGAGCDRCCFGLGRRPSIKMP